MSDAVESGSTAPAVTTPKKAAAKKTTVKKPAAKPTHPPASVMVIKAIAELKDKKGSSLPAIKKFISAHYKIDASKQSVFIRKYLKSAVEKKTLVQTKGTGAAGRFKLAAEGEKKVVKKPTKKPAAKKSTGEKKTAAKKPAVEKKTTVKKSAAVKKSPTKKPKVAKAAKPKSPSKTKKVKPVASKPKSPKPKKAVTSKTKPAAKK